MVEVTYPFLQHGSFPFRVAVMQPMSCMVGIIMAYPDISTKSLASFPGPAQLSVACIFPHGCKIKSGSGLGTRLQSHHVSTYLGKPFVEILHPRIQ